jgi:hypothetical protein
MLFPKIPQARKLSLDAANRQPETPDIPGKTASK